MGQLIQNLVEWLENVVQNSSFLISLIVGMSIIILESMIPILPLALFIAINMLVFGNLFGFFLSWVSTIIGCSLSFFVFRYLRKYLNHFFERHYKYKRLIDIVDNISFSNLVIILSIPFTPAFSINIGAGLSHMKYSKYLFGLLISKIFLVYFWGFIGSTFIESITDMGVLAKLGTMVFIAFILSKMVMHKFNI